MAVRKAVCVNTAIYTRIGQYADLKGIRIEQAAEEALQEWWDLFGESRVKRQKSKPRSAKVLHMAARAT